MLLAAVLIPLLGSLLAWRAGEHARRIAHAAVLLSLLATLINLYAVSNGGRVDAPYLSADAVNALPMAVFAALSLATLALLPKREWSARVFAEIPLVLAATLTAYAAEHLALLGAAWLLASWPLLFDGERSLYARGVVLGSVLALQGSIFLIGTSSGSFELQVLQASHGAPGGVWAFGLLALAIFLRKGIFPLHSWPAAAFERGSLLPAALLVNGHLGAFLLARVGLPLFPAISREFFPLLADLALFTAALAAVAAIAERSPRRMLGLLLVSQASIVLAGLESLTPEGVTGALVQWMVVSGATTGLCGVYQALESRVDQLGQRSGFLGLANIAPRLSVFFVVCGLALVGLPGTLGFAAEDLLLHGTLQSHPWIGLALPLATALNAFSIFRLFARLFLGRPILPSTISLDALPRERWALGAIVVFLVAGGLMPGQLVKLQSSAADAIVASLHTLVSKR
ncbi:MAG: hypothetical protein K2X03_20245 [Bryobacteraceae bacterium]|nr:hypothetical protein [Bryobacteraceae bacterium]